ncbi:MAG TPA: PIN domain-containing protein [Ktedonobacterales bacterium]
MLTAVLDANVLLPAPLRDTLLRAAEAGLFAPRWSVEILDEVERNLMHKWRLTDERAARLITVMRRQFSEALVDFSADFVATMPNDPKDKHVMAAAVVAGAQLIVTHNLRDFPEVALAPYGIEACSPDVFLSRLLASEANVMTQDIVQQAADLRNPPMTVDDVLHLLALHAPTFVDLVRSRLDQQPPSQGN